MLYGVSSATHLNLIEMDVGRAISIIGGSFNVPNETGE